MFLEYFLIALALVAPLALLLAYRQGTIDGQRTARDEPQAPVVRRPKRRVKPNKEILRWTQIESNIQAYNGTSQGQKKVK